MGFFCKRDVLRKCIVLVHRIACFHEPSLEIQALQMKYYRSCEITLTHCRPGFKSGCWQQQAGSWKVCGSMFNLLCSGCQFSCLFKPLDIRWKSIQSSLSPMWSPCGQNTKATTQSRTAYASFVVGKKMLWASLYRRAHLWAAEIQTQVNKRSSNSAAWHWAKCFLITNNWDFSRSWCVCRG